MAMMQWTLGTNLSFVIAVGDPTGARTVMSLVAILAALGVALLMVAVWMHRTTRPDAELLAPLEVMGDRGWRRGDPVWQRRRLDEVRPAGATPLRPSAAPPEVDDEYDSGPRAPGFDDFGAEEVIAGEDRTTGSATGRSTPVGISRVDLDIPDNDLDEVEPEVLAAAIAELDAQLSKQRPGDG